MLCSQYAYSIGGPMAPQTIGKMADFRKTRAIILDKKVQNTSVPLDVLPMKYNKKDSERKSAEIRYLKTDEIKRIRQNTQILTNLRSYSRTRFHDYLSRINNESDGVEVYRIPLTKYPTSGPTLPGSPIHNLRIREETAVPLHDEDEILPENDVYDHGRRKTPVNIVNILRERDEDFYATTVDKPPPVFRRSGTTANRNVLIHPKDPERFLSGWSFYSELDAVDKEKKTTTPIPTPKSRTVLSDSRPKSRLSPDKSKKSGKNKKPRHWVDDLTVSSDGSDKLQPIKEPELVALPKSRKWTKARRASIISLSRESIHSRKSSLKNLAKVETKSQETSNSALILPVPEKPQENSLGNLPGFICPSSETKSREYSVKEWLLKATFTNSQQNIPLVGR